MLIEKASLDPRSRFYIQPNRIVWQTSDNAAPKNSDLRGKCTSDASVCMVFTKMISKS